MTQMTEPSTFKRPEWSLGALTQHWVEALFSKMAPFYGSRFASMWTGVSVGEVQKASGLELAKQFAVEPAQQGDALSPRQRGPRVVAPDAVADCLRGEGLVLGEDREGALRIACPWQHEHTTGEPDDGSTVWFPAGTSGYDRGHFKCLHGHCTGRGGGEFLEVVGYAKTATTRKRAQGRKHRSKP
jgi:hypothetical protein